MGEAIGFREDIYYIYASDSGGSRMPKWYGSKRFYGQTRKVAMRPSVKIRSSFVPMTSERAHDVTSTCVFLNFQLHAPGSRSFRFEYLRGTSFERWLCLVACASGLIA